MALGDCMYFCGDSTTPTMASLSIYKGKLRRIGYTEPATLDWKKI